MYIRHHFSENQFEVGTTLVVRNAEIVVALFEKAKDAETFHCMEMLSGLRS